jgi:(+)-trans-carveol dehydrogenase/(-)-trans-carveol dehydrogenase
MDRVKGKVAFITGAARGMGRAHAVRLAEEGADIIAIDLMQPLESVSYPLSGPEDLEETKALVEKTGQRILTRPADVRSQGDLDAAVAAGLDAFGHIDIVCGNAGIASFGPTWELPEGTWQEMIDINLSGVWHTAKAAVPAMIDAGQGGAIVLVSSVAGLKGIPNIAHYSAAKHGLVGLMRSLANELAPHRIRVNTVHPTNVATPMVQNDTTFRAFRPDLLNPSEEESLEAMAQMNAIPIPWVDPVDVSNAVLWLASDEARYVTGVALPIDAGMTIK